MQHIVIVGRGKLHAFSKKLFKSYCTTKRHQELPVEDKTLNKHGGALVKPAVIKAPFIKKK